MLCQNETSGYISYNMVHESYLITLKWPRVEEWVELLSSQCPWFGPELTLLSVLSYFTYFTCFLFGCPLGFWVSLHHPMKHTGRCFIGCAKLSLCLKECIPFLYTVTLTKMNWLLKINEYIKSGHIQAISYFQCVL